MQHDSCSVKLAAGDADALDRLFHFGLCAQSHLGDCSYLPGAMERKYVSFLARLTRGLAGLTTRDSWLLQLAAR